MGNRFYQSVRDILMGSVSGVGTILMYMPTVRCILITLTAAPCVGGAIRVFTPNVDVSGSGNRE